MKKYILIAGVNGAGKSTLYQTNLNLQGIPRVNTDEILREFGDWKNEKDVLKAGKIAVRKISQYFLEEKTFNHRESPCHIVGKFKLEGAFIAPFNYIIATQWGGKSLLCVNMLY